ncbi:MAG: hypothetical protein AB8G26_01565 [Ilumatobacter sp.]
MSRRAVLRSVVAISAVVAGSLVPAASSHVAVASDCADEPVTAASLDAAFAAGVDGIVGADYQRAVELDDGRVLWVFQDVFIETSDGELEFVHNAGALQTGGCFEALVGGTEERPQAWVGSETSHELVHWYWPLDGYQLDADTFVLHLAEMEERGDRYLDNATPVATWEVSIDLTSMTVGPLRPAPDPTTALYGFEIVDDGDVRYFYGQCHRQFGFGEIGHDECAATVLLARRPIDEPQAPLEYWDGDEWTRNSRRAENVAPLVTPGEEQFRFANPMQVEYDDGRWIAVTKVNDWFGGTLHFDVAEQPQGPWTTTSVRPVAPPGDPAEVTSYFASFVPSDEEGWTLAVSSNRWDGAYSNAYRPRFETVDERLWRPHAAVKLAGDVWLPIGRRL